MTRTAGGGGVPFWPLVTGIRWGTLGVGLLLAAFGGAPVAPALAWGGLLIADASWRTVRPSTGLEGRGRRARVGTMAEPVLCGVVVVATGGWESPFIFSLLAPVVAAGFARGSGAAMRSAGVVILCVAAGYHFDPRGAGRASLEATVQSGTGLLLAALLAGYIRRLFGEAERRHTAALDRMAQLTEANELLVSLHRMAQSLPASLDLEQVLRSTLDQVRSLITFDVAVVLVRDDVRGRWTIAASEGATLGPSLEPAELPAPVRAAAASSVASLVVCLAPGEGLGASRSRSGLYAPLRARGALVGLIALEHHEPGHYERRDLRLLDGLMGPAALGIDNAGWFARLRALGAEEERTRIARDMHDSVGQSLAYLAFKLDRMSKLAGDTPLGQELEVLRGEVRGVLTEVREALCDLRTDVTDERGLVETLGAFLDRVGRRSELEVTFHHEEEARLPLQQEREVWRIAQEAVSNVERHARAGHLRVRWQCDGRSARLTVGDDGRGFAVARAERSDRYGITGMKERASAIGARLIIESEPFVGTLIECRVDPAPADGLAGRLPVEAA